MKEDTGVLSKFGSRLRELRLERNLSQEALGYICNLDRTYISDVERGKRNISLINIDKLARGLNVQVNDFF